MLWKTYYSIFDNSVHPSIMELHGNLTRCHQRIIKVADRKGEHLLSLDQQVYLEAYGSTTTFVNTELKRITICRNLGYYEKLLPSCFVRVNRTYIISLHFLQRIRTDNTLKLRIPECPIITLNATYRAHFDVALQTWNSSLL